MGVSSRGTRHGLGAVEAPPWARALIASRLLPSVTDDAGKVLVWSVDDHSTATVSSQFTADAGAYHKRYAASDHFEALIAQALSATGVTVGPNPHILDLGSGSGVNSVIPCQRLFPGARIIAADLSVELLEILARNTRAEDVCCVALNAMSRHAAPGAFDLVTGASILHHLERPQEGIAAAGQALRPGGCAIFLEPFHGWGILRLAYERILAESALRGGALDPALADGLSAIIGDIAARTNPDRFAPGFVELDDKWLFSRAHFERWAREAGFAAVGFVPHNDHASLYLDTTAIQLKLSGVDAILPPWATDIVAGYDAALPLQAKRELMLEGSIVMTKA